MKTITALFGAVILMSCTPTKDPIANFTIASLEYELDYAERRYEQSIFICSIYYQENPQKFESTYKASVELDSIIDCFMPYCDPIIEDTWGGLSMKELISCYNKTLEDIALLKYKNYIDIDGPPRLAGDEFKKRREKELALLLKNNVLVAGAEAMDYASQDYSSSGYRFQVPNIQIAFDGKNKLDFSDPLIQDQKYRQIKLTKFLKDGKPFKVDRRIVDSFNFGSVICDSLPPGSYQIEGDVHALFYNSWFTLEPFTHDFAVKENP